jgi:hypothetical protein
MLAPATLPLALKLEVVEGVELPGSDDPYGAAYPAIAARGAPFGNELLAPECDAPVPAVTGFDANGRLIDEHHCENRNKNAAREERRVDAREARDYSAA